MVNYAKELRHVDLNLLPVFLTLMRERSLTKAAKVLHLGQPAVSAALKRLRNTFGDELLYRTARGMEPTWRAIELAALIEPVMGDMLRAVDVPRRFDPATEQRIFRIGMPDNHEYFLMPALLRRKRQAFA
jgi:LysR family transcriptional regulator, mexEF-oprN operon transcriptional activator